MKESKQQSVACENTCRDANISCNIPKLNKTCEEVLVLDQHIDSTQVEEDKEE